MIETELRTRKEFLNSWKTVQFLILMCVVSAVSASAQQFGTLIKFSPSNGQDSEYGSFMQGIDGNLYGVTRSGSSYGNVFRITPQGALTKVYRFCSLDKCFDGAAPNGTLAQTSDGDLYGTTQAGGYETFGTVYTLSTSGQLRTLYHFGYKDGFAGGGDPLDGLTLGLDDNFYATAESFGIGESGTVFKITSQGTRSTLHSFCVQSGCPDGQFPVAGLIQATDGNFYGTAIWGGDTTCDAPTGCGTVFKLTPNGTFTILHSFHTEEGSYIVAGLVQGSDGNFYGAAAEGADSSCAPYGCGTIFKITPNGEFTILHRFTSAEGNVPFSALIQATNGNFYGTTYYGGGGSCSDSGGTGCGTIYQMTPSGVVTTLHSFNGSDGVHPINAVFQDTNGKFYGTTSQGGGDSSCDPNGCGTIYGLDMKLGPFVAFMQAQSVGKVGATIGILGQGFTGASGVSFSGTAAAFQIQSDTYLTATVPAGAKSGPVTVTSTQGKVASNIPFRVTPAILTFDPPSGPVGTQVKITGSSLTQTVRVGFGDVVPAQFTVNSDSLVTATVPNGAKTGKIGIKTLGGVALSTGTFTVTQ